MQTQESSNWIYMDLETKNQLTVNATKEQGSVRIFQQNWEW